MKVLGKAGGRQGRGGETDTVTVVERGGVGRFFMEVTWCKAQR